MTFHESSCDSEHQWSPELLSSSPEDKFSLNPTDPRWSESELTARDKNCSSLVIISAVLRARFWVQDGDVAVGQRRPPPSLVLTETGCSHPSALWAEAAARSCWTLASQIRKRALNCLSALHTRSRTWRIPRGWILLHGTGVSKCESGPKPNSLGLTLTPSRRCWLSGLHLPGAIMWPTVRTKDVWFFCRTCLENQLLFRPRTH